MQNENKVSDLDNRFLFTKCYKCNCEILDFNQKYCQNCNAILNPNELKWKRSFFLCLCLFCTFPFLLAIIVMLFAK